MSGSSDPDVISIVNDGFVIEDAQRTAKRKNWGEINANGEQRLTNDECTDPGLQASRAHLALSCHYQEAIFPVLHMP